jgi:hypothetical protein
MVATGPSGRRSRLCLGALLLGAAISGAVTLAGCSGGQGSAGAGQPWFVLTSSSGKTVWSHDGWLSSSALEAAAARHC